MLTKTAIALSAAILATAAVGSAQAGYVYDEGDYTYVPHHHVHVYQDEEVVVVHPHHDHYYQKKVLVGQHYTYQTCHYETRWDAEGQALPIEECQ
jgi:hypothetical protein